MNPRFKPLIAESAEGQSNARPFNLKAVSADLPAVSFKPLSSVLPAAAKGSVRRPDGEGDAGAATEPKLETRRDGDRISRITVTCDCGRSHDIECEY